MATNPRDLTGALPVNAKAAACVTQGIKIKGELHGSEDLFIDGQVEGSVSFPNSVVTVGPNAKVKAEITAREVVVRGRVEGKISGSEKIQVWSSARINGDMRSERIAVEDGAELHGALEVGKAMDRSQDSAKSTTAKKVEVGKQPSPGAAVAGAD